MRKKCARCKKYKDIARFSRRGRSKDGLADWCKSCFSIYFDGYRRGKGRNNVLAANARYKRTDKGIEGMKRYRRSDKGIMTGRRNMANSRIRYPDRISARRRIKYLVDRGLISPAMKFKCRCGNRAESYHHYKGYDERNREKVIPLCGVCHRREHKKGRKNKC